MMTSKIVPATLRDATVFRYGCNGKIHRVFDTNSAGELLPVAYELCDPAAFQLRFAPHGMVYAEITNDYY